MLDYMLLQLGIEESEVPKLCLDLYKEYGTTMAGLKVHNTLISYLYGLILKPQKKNSKNLKFENGHVHILIDD